MTSGPHAGAAPGAPGAPGALAFPPPPPSGAGAPIASSTSDGASAWTEHTAPDGRRKYWHNASTGKSTYEKPACLMTATERADLTTRWKEAVAPDGRAYFHNLDTKETRWAMPDVVRAAREAALAAEGAKAAKMALMRANAAAAATTTPTTNGDGRTAVASTTTSIAEKTNVVGEASPDDPKAVFAACLSACGVTSAQRWDETIRMVERHGDDRFYVLKTAAERKKAFHEFQARQKKREREEKRMDDKKKRKEFETMLREAETTLGCGAPGFAFREVAEDLAKDQRYAERFRAVENDREKEDLYRAHCDALRVRERERRRLARDDARRRFATRLATEFGVDFENDAWRDARRAILADNEEALVTNEEDEGGAHMTTPTPYSCDRYDRLVAFEDAVLAAEEATEKRRTVAELSRRVAEKKNRDAFVAFLEKKREAKRLTLRLPWRDFVEAESLEAEETFRAVSRNASGSRPRELYEDQLEILETQAARDRDAVVAALARAGALDEISSEWTDGATTATNAPRSAAVRRALARTDPETLVAAGEKHIDAVDKSLRDIDAVHGNDTTHGNDDTRARLRRACLDAAAVASSEDAARRRRRRRAAEAFSALLESSVRRRVVRLDWTWEEVSRKLSREPEWREMCFFDMAGEDDANENFTDDGYAFASDAEDRDAYRADARAAFAACGFRAGLAEEGELEEGEAPDPKRARREP
jgi:pre-mRNA-processing factor 40